VLSIASPDASRIRSRLSEGKARIFTVFGGEGTEDARRIPEGKILSGEAPEGGTMMHDCSEESKIRPERGRAMDSIYKIIDVVGTSKTSWEDAAKNAVETAGKSLEDLRVGEIVKLDLVIEKAKVVAYRARVNISFKYRA
jgi:dodecin